MSIIQIQLEIPCVENWEEDENKRNIKEIPALFSQQFDEKLIKCQEKVSEIIGKLSVSGLDKPKTCICFHQPFLKRILEILQKTTLKNLGQSILQVYLQISEINTQLYLDPKQNQTGINLLEQILSQINPLVYDHFIILEYHNNKVKKPESQKISKINEPKDQYTFLRGSSDPTNNEQNSFMPIDSQNDGLLEQIKNKIMNHEVNELMQKFIDQQKTEMINSIEICRICERQIPLKNILSHVKLCSNRAQIETQIAELKCEWIKIVQIIERQQQKTAKIHVRNQKQEKYLRILKRAKTNNQSFQKAAKKRRNSQLQKGTQQIRFQTLIDEIQLFEMNHGHDEVLQLIYQNKKKQEFLQKKMNSLQINELFTENGSSEAHSYQSIVESIENTIQIQIKTKKSLFAQSKRQLSESSEDSSYLSLSSNSKSTIKKEGNGIIRSKRTLKTLIPNKIKGQLDDLTESISKEVSERLWKTQKHLFSSKQPQESSISLSDFEILKFLGKGAYGNVYLARRKKTKSLYALKHIKYSQYTATNQLQLIRKQHEIFKKIAGDHLIKAPYAFTESFGHFFVLEFMPGGDLSKVLEEEVYLEEQQAKFYLAEIVLALEHLHNCEIIHRDLKPENIVIDQKGHIKLTDFGLSEIKMRNKLNKALQSDEGLTKNNSHSRRCCRRAALVSKTETDKIIGTPDYIAPQIINRTSINNKSIDWWSLGVLTYEILVGCRPFSAETIQEVLNNIIAGDIVWPEIGTQEGMISPEAADLISRLLNKNFQSRLGSVSVQQIKQHPFFRGIEWENIRIKKPPFIQSVKDENVYKHLKEDTSLRQEIIGQKTIQKSASGRQKPLKVDNFVRYDLLTEETYQSMESKIKSNKNKINRLQSISLNVPKASKKAKNNKRIRFSIEITDQ